MEKGQQFMDEKKRVKSSRDEPKNWFNWGISIFLKVVVAFIKAAVAIGVGIVAGVAAGFGLYHGVSLKEILLLVIGATVGVLVVMLIFKHKIFNNKK